MEGTQNKDTKELNDVKELQKQNRALLELVRQLQVKLYVAESRLKEKEVYEEELKKTHEEQLLRLNSLFERLLNETFARLCTRSEVTSGNDVGPTRGQASTSSGERQQEQLSSASLNTHTNSNSNTNTSTGIRKSLDMSSQPTFGAPQNGIVPAPSRSPLGQFGQVTATPPVPPPVPPAQSSSSRPKLKRSDSRSSMVMTQAPPKPEASSTQEVAAVQQVSNPEQMRSRPSSAIRESAAQQTSGNSAPSESVWTGGQTFV